MDALAGGVGKTAGGASRAGGGMMAAMSPARRARQSAIMRERWATRPDAMAAILAKAQAARVASGRGGWQAYHQAAGHDGGYSAALADGGHDGPYAAVRSLDYWEALYEPPWDIGWDRMQGVGWQPCQPRPRISEEEWRRYCPPVTPATNAPDNPARQAVADQRRQGAQVRAARKARGWTQRQLADALGVSVGTIGTLERRGVSGGRVAQLAEHARGVLADPTPPPPPRPRPAPAPLPPVAQPRIALFAQYICAACGLSMAMERPLVPGRYQVRCYACGHVAQIQAD